MKKLLPVFLLALCLPFTAAHAVKSPFITTTNGDGKVVTGRQTPFSSWEHPNTYRQSWLQQQQRQGHEPQTRGLNNDETVKSGARKNNGNFVTRPNEMQHSEDYN